MKVKWKTILPIVVVGLVLCSYCVWQFVSVAYEQGEVKQNLLDANIECVHIECDGSVFKQIENDPQIIISLNAEEFNGILLELLEPVKEETQVQVFWSHDLKFEEVDSTLATLQEQESELEVGIPSGDWDYIRIDMDGTYQFRSLSAVHYQKQYYIDETEYVNIITTTLAVLCVYLIALYMHNRRAKRTNHYVLSLFGISKKKRNAQYDYLRVLATIMVICTHALQSDVSLIEGDTARSYLMTYLYVICLSCNLIYVMLSGALLLQAREESLLRFYFVRITRVALPMLIYYVYYLYVNGVAFHVSTISLIIERLFTGTTPESPHYWLLYTLLGLYVAFPFLRIMLKHMNNKSINQLAVLIIIFMCINTFSTVIGKNFAVGSFLGSWMGVALLGYWMSLPQTRGYDTKLIFVGCTSLILIAILMFTYDQFLAIVVNCNIIMVLLALGIFAFIKKGKLFQKNNYIIMLFSKYSYSIILIHWYVLHAIVIGKYGVHSYQFYVFGGLILSLIYTLCISLFLAFVIDFLLVVPLQEILDLLISKSKMMIEYHKGVKKNSNL